MHGRILNNKNILVASRHEIFMAFSHWPVGIPLPGPKSAVHLRRFSHIEMRLPCVPHTVRRALPKDLPALVAIEAQCGRSWSQEQILAELERDTAIVLTAEIADFICGLLISWMVVDELQLLELVVHPDARRRGIARMLMQALIETGESNGAAKILLEVSVENEAALALYQDLRFEVVGRRKAYYSDGTDAILMTKSLSPHQLVT